jgi:copper chaperone
LVTIDYTVRKKRKKTMTSIKIKGMSCQHCVASTKKALEGVQGITDVSVDLDKGEACYEGSVPFETVEKAVSAIGFEAMEA